MRIKQLLAIAIVIGASPFPVQAQMTRAEQEVRAFLAEYDKAVARRDIAFLERVLPDDYVFSGASGHKSDRGQVLKFFTKEKKKPSY